MSKNREAEPPVKELAVERGIPVLQPRRIRNEAFTEELAKFDPDLIVVTAYGKILPKAVLDLPRLGCVNVHASLLPAYRGAAPINWAIINGETVSGITTMFMDEGMDTGPVLLTEETPVGATETAGELYDRLAQIGGALLTKTIAGLIDGTVKPVAQSAEGVSYAPAPAPMMKKSDGRIDWTKSAVEIFNLVRGVTPWPGAVTMAGGKSVKIHRGRVGSGSENGEPGTVIETGEVIGVATGGGGVYEILELQLEGKKRMTAEDFLRGFKLAKGDLLD